ncbi:MAG TPA: adenosylmethionine--8-amino-7-oxononanoate transaminase [Dongiaceae bacterium]|jgi:adenosylmethionine-8-amino-7-oxononanoate aminotransferase|nr:adenosylmethionine--8-amino-7-oxononanoate transaminase [Dongiaceae bacterium]
MAEADRGRATPSPDWLTSGSSHLWLPYAQMKVAPTPIAVVGAEGARLKLADGRELIDGVSSWWTVCHGYNHPHIRAAVAAQLQAVPHVMLGGLATEPTLRLAKRLADLLPGDLDHMFFSESGSVSVEIAMKMAVQYWINRGQTGRHRFVSFRFGYHGDTLAAMSVCDPDEGMHGLFKGYLPQQIIADVPATREQQAEFTRLLRAHRDEVAAVIIEPLVQGAGGMKFYGPEVLRFLRQACDEADCLLILDEIMTGFGRIGPMFACAEAEIVPDIITLSKALTGGTLPLAATIATRKVFEAFLSDDPGKALMHGPTYMGNALACAAANASLDLFEREPRLSQVRAVEAQLRAELEPCRRLTGVVDVRVRGALGVVQLTRAGEGPWFRPRFLEDGVWIRPFGDIVYVAPPFVIPSDELARLTQAIVRHVSAWSQQRAAA